MKAERTSQPVPPPPPDTVTLTMTLDEARMLKSLAGYDQTVPEAIYSDLDDPESRKMAKFMGVVLAALRDADLYRA